MCLDRCRAPHDLTLMLAADSASDSCAMCRRAPQWQQHARVADCAHGDRHGARPDAAATRDPPRNALPCRRLRGATHMTTEPIRRIDHVSVLVADPQPLFSVLTTTLGLPVAWPIGQFVGFTGAGVGVGNVPLEIIRFAPSRRSRIPLDRGELAVALEPIPTPAAVAELDRRGIPHAPPVPYAGGADDTPASTYAGWSPGAGPLWTVTLLGGFFGDERLARSYSRPGSHSRAAGAATRAVSRATARLGLA